MSGPKSYSVRVFDKKLTGLFHRQTELQALIDELRELSVHDNERGINIGCDDFLDENREQIEQLLQQFTINYTGRINQTVYNDLKFQINKQVTQLTQFIDRLKFERDGLDERKRDYAAFVEYEKFRIQATDTFNTVRQQMTDYIGSYLETDAPEMFNKAQESISSVTFNVPNTDFTKGFASQKDALMSAIQSEFNRCREQIDMVRTEIGAEITDLLGDSDISASITPPLSEETQKIETRLRKVEDFIITVGDPHRRKQYQDKLANLRASTVLKDEYYFTELLDDFRKAEKSHILKEQLHQAIAGLSEGEWSKSVTDDRSALVTKGTNLIGKETVAGFEIDDFRLQVKLLREKNVAALTDDKVKSKERSFVRDQLVKSLQSMHYEVMDDMQVVDFENQSDFLLKVPRQDNYINLRFDDKGNMLYNFLIKENKDDLSIDQKQEKLQQMDSTCSQFRGVLNELKEMGLNINLETAKPTSEKYLMSVPQKYADRIKDETQVQVKREAERKRYLDR